MEIVRVTAPENAFADRVKAFLQHKGQPWMFHVEKAFQGDTDRLENHFYLGMLGEDIVFNVMTAEFRGIGDFGHVFTRPEHRRKHAASLVIERQMADFRARGGRALYLGTGYDSPAYHIYSAHGFRSLFPKSGMMAYFARERVIEDYLAAGNVRVEDAAWRHWPTVFLLMVQPSGRWIRSIGSGCLGPSGFEGGYLSLRLRQLLRNEPLQVKVLVSERDSVVGFATLGPEPRWQSGIGLLDLFVHPAFARSAPLLVNAFNYSWRKVQCHVEADAEADIAALGSAGFRVEATLKGQVAVGEQFKDVLVMSRTTI
jgi:GNAT superfamily N-acetyltransferase